MTRAWPGMAGRGVAGAVVAAVIGVVTGAGTGAAAAARAAEPAPVFAARAELRITEAGEGLQRVVLPLAVLQRLRTADRRDLRVLNAAGEAVPMAWAGEPAAPAPASGPPVALPLFVWPADEGRLPNAASEVQVELGRDGAVVRVRPGPSAVAAGARAWLVDLGPLKGAVPSAIQLHWPVPDGGVVRQVQLFASSDARQWRPAGEGTLIDLPASVASAPGGAALRQQRIELAAPAALTTDPPRYLRLQLDGPLPLTRAEAIARPAEAAPALDQARFKPQRSGPRTWTLDTQATLPVTRLQLHLPQDNAVWPLALAWRPDDAAQAEVGSAAGTATRRHADDWQPLPGHTAYRLQRGGTRLDAPPQALDPPVQARHWRLTLDDRIAAPDEGPELTLAWVPPALVFAARGSGPFHLVFGAASAPPVALARDALIPGYAPGAEWRLPLAQPGPVVELPGGPAAGAGRFGMLADTPPRQLLLWGLLGLAVVVLAGLAWRLARDLGRGASTGR